LSHTAYCRIAAATLFPISMDPPVAVCKEKKQDRSAHMCLVAPLSIQHSDDESTIKANDTYPFVAMLELYYRSVEQPRAPER
jgi:hypothetical protein